MDAPSGATRVAGIIGWPVAHSLSPAMHNAAFAALGLDWVYVAFPVEQGRVPDALTGLAAAGVAGLNVTIPHKQAALAQASAASDAARAIGAANTLVRIFARLSGGRGPLGTLPASTHTQSGIPASAAAARYFANRSRNGRRPAHHW